MKVTEKQGTLYLKDIKVGQAFKFKEDVLSYYMVCEMMQEDDIAVPVVFDLNENMVYPLERDDMDRQVVPFNSIEVIVQ